MTHDVHRNLRLGGWSILHKGVKVGHRDEVSVANARCARAEGRRNVHAFIRGDIMPFAVYSGQDEVTYNPFKHSTFVWADDEQSILRKQLFDHVTCTPDGKAWATRSER